MSNGMMLPMQPFEVYDHSGGITDFYLQGDSKRYVKADNFVITIDKKLETRDPFIAFDANGNHVMAGSASNNRRIDGWLLFKDKSELLANQGRDIFYLNSTPAWTRLTGPSGNPAVGLGDRYNFVSYSEWRDQVYFTSDAGSLPGKFYRDSTGVMQVRTAGLPRPRCTPKYTESSLLAACLLLANDLRTSMVAHIKDETNSAGVDFEAGYLHAMKDKWSLSYFESQSWSASDAENPGPQPVPTPATLADDDESLFDLVEALALAYEHHAFDFFEQNYHFAARLDIGGLLENSPARGPTARLSNNTRPTDLTTAATQLDEIKMHWLWHRLAVYGHVLNNNYLAMNVYEVNAPSIGTVDLIGVPEIVPNYNTFISYVNTLRNMHNAHVTNGASSSVISDVYFHAQKMNDSYYHTITLPEAHDLATAYLTLHWVRIMYGDVHLNDLAQNGATQSSYTNFTMDTTAGSANVTDVKTSGGAITLTIGEWVITSTDVFNDADSKNRRAARVTASGSGTATLSKTATSTTNDQAAQHSVSFYHGFFANHVLTTTSDWGVPEDQDISATEVGISWQKPATLAAWVEDAEQLYSAYAAHVQDAQSHDITFSPPIFLYDIFSQPSTFFVPVIASYSYAVTLKNTYTLDSGIEFTDISAPLLFGPVETVEIAPLYTRYTSGITDVDDGGVSEVATVTLNNLPELVNDNSTNYDTSNIEVEIYRTTNSGTTYFLNDTVDLGTTSFEDSVSDSLDAPGLDRLDTRETLYTTGGVVENTAPPQARFIHISKNNNTAYYGYIEDSGQIFKGRVLQSIPDDPDSVPGNFFDDLGDELTGISSARGNVIGLCLHSIHRLIGGFTELGLGALTHETISDTVGCVSPASIVETEVGLFFAGTSGFYYTDGFQVIPIAIDINLSYAKVIQTDAQARRIYGTYDTLNRRIIWTAQREPSDVDCDMAFVYHLNFGIKPAGVYTTWSGGENYDNFRPSSFVYFNNELILGDRQGVVLKSSKWNLADLEIPRTNIGTSLTAWNTTHVDWLYRSCALDFGTIYKGQWVSKFHILGKNKGNVNIQPYAIADNRLASTEGKKPLSMIVYRENDQWGDATQNWGDEDDLWGDDGKLDAKRRFPAGGTLRSQLKQIELSPARAGIYRYDDYPPFSYVTVDNVLLTATLAQPSGYTQVYWPLDIIGMTIAFEDDDYVTEFEISAVSNNELTFLDPDIVSQSLSGLKWVIRGYQKEAGFSLNSYSIEFSNLGERGRVYQGLASRGENAE